MHNKNFTFLRPLRLQSARMCSHALNDRFCCLRGVFPNRFFQLFPINWECTTWIIQVELKCFAPDCFCWGFCTLRGARTGKQSHEGFLRYLDADHEFWVWRHGHPNCHWENIPKPQHRITWCKAYYFLGWICGKQKGPMECFFKKTPRGKCGRDQSDYCKHAGLLFPCSSCQSTRKGIQEKVENQVALTKTM